MKTKYISDGTWFDEGTECILEDDCSIGVYKAGIFSGIRTCVNSRAEGGRPIGNKYLDEEYCIFDEFEIINENK